MAPVMASSDTNGTSSSAVFPSGLTRVFQSRDVDAIAFACLAGTLFGIAFSIALGQLFAGLCLVATVAGLAARRIAWRWPVEAWLALVFGLVAAISIWIGVDPRGYWLKAGELLWFALIPATVMLVRDSGRARTLALAFIAGCAVRGLETCVVNPWRAWHRPTPDFLTALIDRGSMTDGQMLMLGTVITLALLLLAWRGDRRVSGWLVVAIVLQAAGLLLNFKRGSWFCAALLAGGVVLVHARWRTWLALLGILVLLAALPPVRARLGQLDREFDVTGGGRLTMWCRVAPALVEAHPAGVGYGALTNELMRKAYARVERNRNHLHANWAQVLVETGWVGLAVYAAWMIWIVWTAVRGALAARGGPAAASAAAALIAIAGLLLNGLVEYNFGDVELMMVFAIFAGIIAAQRRAGFTPSSAAAP